MNIHPIQIETFNRLRALDLWIGVMAALYLAVLPMSKTMALRNSALCLLLIFLVFRDFRSLQRIRLPVPILLWVGYLLLFPFIADSSDAAVESVLGQWGRGCLAMLAGAGVARIYCGKRSGGAISLGVISAFSVLLHLGLAFGRGWETSSIPWGYWGREMHHADLGFAAGQAVILLVASMCASRNRMWPLVISVILACFFSMALAQSRAGLIFCLIAVALVIVPVYLRRNADHRMRMLSGLVVMLFAGAAVLALAISEDVRWRKMSTQLSAGLLGDAIKIECEGLASVTSQVTTQYGQGADAEHVIEGMRDGDAARVVLLRAGIDLAIMHPWGSDGSRQAFQKLLKKECANPSISMSHTHNGWLDTALSLGWIGAVLYLAVLGYFLRMGIARLRQTAPLNEWVLVLIALSLFWILRGFTDSIFRDHMLEMQGFMLFYAAVALTNQSSESKLVSA